MAEDPTPADTPATRSHSSIEPAAGDIVTRSDRGQWVSEVVGDRESSRSFTSRGEAVEAGRALAQASGAQHIVIDSEPTGVIVDE